MMVRTRDEDGGVLMSIRDKGGKLERLSLQVRVQTSCLAKRPFVEFIFLISISTIT